MRDAFLLDPSITFLNHGSFGAMPKEVFEAYIGIVRELEAEPVEFLGRRSGALLEAALVELGIYLGAEPGNLAFVDNATTGIGIAAASIALSEGDEVLGTDHEYGACAMAWKRAAARRGAAYRAFSVPLPYRGDEDFLRRLFEAVGPRTRALFISHITSPTALRFPVEAAASFARSRGLVLVVDGAHAPGQIGLGLEALGADYYTGNCHKWMCAPKGSAFLYVKPERHAEVEPPVASWGLVAEAEGGTAHDAYAGKTTLARRLRWLGTRNPAAFLALPAALRFLALRDGAPERARCAALAEEAAARGAAALGLEPIHPAPGLRMCLVPLPPRDAAAVKARMFDEFRIEAPIVSHEGRIFLRLSFHIYNGEADIEALTECLRTIFGRGSARGKEIGGDHGL